MKSFEPESPDLSYRGPTSHKRAEALLAMFGATVRRCDKTTTGDAYAALIGASEIEWLEVNGLVVRATASELVTPPKIEAWLAGEQTARAASASYATIHECLQWISGELPD